MDLSIQPVQPGPVRIPIPPAVVASPAARPSVAPDMTDAVTLALDLQARLSAHVLQLGVESASWRARLKQLREDAAAKRALRETLRAEAAAEARLRRKQREADAISTAPEGRIRLAYSASELREILQTAQRLNIQA